MSPCPDISPPDPTGPGVNESVRAISLDVGSTLIDPHPSVGHLYAEVAAQQGHPGLSPDLLNQRFRIAFEGCSQHLHARADWAAVVDQTFHGLVAPPPSQSFFLTLYDRFSQPTAWRIHPDVIPALTALHTRRIPLVVISNWDNRLRPLLRCLHLARFFQQIVVSCEVGLPKPNPAIFQQAAQLLNLPPASILHIGDQPLEDVIGARNAGFQSLLLDRDQPPLPNARIAALTQLL
jgi:putative hydrolase of the HAD superfamily